MSRLSDLLRKKIGDRYDAADVKIKEDKEQVQEEIKMYNKSWLLRTSNQYGYIINHDREHADKILNALNRTGGNCPCGGNGSQYKCPCIYMRENGICRCGLFENVTHVNPTGRSTVRIKGE